VLSEEDRFGAPLYRRRVTVRGTTLPPVVCSSARDVEERDGRHFASTDSPWLKCEIDPARLAGRWVRLTYASGFLDPLVRPVLRIIVGDERRDEILPAALHGRGCWLGPIPNGATATHASTLSGKSAL